MLVIRVTSLSVGSLEICYRWIDLSIDNITILGLILLVSSRAWNAVCVYLCKVFFEMFRLCSPAQSIILLCWSFKWFVCKKNCSTAKYVVLYPTKNQLLVWLCASCKRIVMESKNEGMEEEEEHPK